MTKQLEMRILLTVALLCAFLLGCMTARAQSLPRWPQNTQIKIAATSDREQVQQAIEAWRPWLRGGLTMELVGANQNLTEAILLRGVRVIDIVRDKVKGEERGECQLRVVDGYIQSGVIRIDPSLKGEDFKLAVEHEIGHALGLQHRPNSIMSKPYVRTVKFAGLIPVARIVRHPDASDAAELHKLYEGSVTSDLVSQAIVFNSTITSTPETVSPVQVLAESTPPPAPILIHRYAYRRVVTIKDETGVRTVRSSTFTFNDKGERVETDVILTGRDPGKKFWRQIPEFEIAAHPSQPQGWAIAWTDESGWGTLTEGLAWFREGANKSGLLFPSEADRGNVHVKFYNYRVFSTEKPIIREVEQ